MKIINFVVPVYNEDSTIEIFVAELSKFFKENNIKYKYEIIFINDGSIDNSSQILESLFQKNDYISYLSFSRNFGKESAVFAGLELCTGDVVIPIDVDLQDPLEVILKLLEEYEKGFEVVLAKRVDRNKDTFFKRNTAESFYWLYNKISKVKLEPNVGDFRLMTRRVVSEIIKLEENQLFMKGVFSWVGFEYSIVEYIRDDRVAGKTKFNGFKLWNLALEGITSFSTFPIRMWLYLGSFIAVISFILSLKVFIEKLFFGIEVEGYASLFIAIFFLGGVQLIGIGVLGEYVGRIYMESKRRPKYVIKQIREHAKK